MTLAQAFSLTKVKKITFSQNYDKVSQLNTCNSNFHETW